LWWVEDAPAGQTATDEASRQGVETDRLVDGLEIRSSRGAPAAVADGVAARAHVVLRVHQAIASSA